MGETGINNQESLSSDGQPKRKRGRQSFEPTDEQRDLVKKLTGFGMRQVEVCKVITNANGSPISDVTLRKHFRDELDIGEMDANAKVANALFKNAMQGSVAAQIFWMKARARWRETDRLELSNPDGTPLEVAPKIVFYIPDNRRMRNGAGAPASADDTAQGGHDGND